MNELPSSNAMPRMRTIKQTAAETGLSEYFIRRLVNENKIVFVYAGRKALVNLDRFIEFLNRGNAS